MYVWIYWFLAKFSPLIAPSWPDSIKESWSSVWIDQWQYIHNMKDIRHGAWSWLDHALRISTINTINKTKSVSLTGTFEPKLRPKPSKARRRTPLKQLLPGNSTPPQAMSTFRHPYFSSTGPFWRFDPLTTCDGRTRVVSTGLGWFGCSLTRGEGMELPYLHSESRW